MKKYVFGLIFFGVICSFSTVVFAALPTITPGTMSAVCSGNYATLPYTSTNSPTTYNISWTGSPAGLPDVPPGTSLPLTSIPVNVFSTCASGTYHGTIVVTNSTGSSSPVSIVITVNGLPTVYGVTGGGGYCAGTPGVHVGLSSSDGGVLYQLYRIGSPIGSPVWGTGAAIDFGLETLTGAYTVMAENAVTLCTNSMSGSVNVSLNAAPPIVTVTGGGNFCIGGAGVPVGISGSVFGASYQLWRSSIAIGSPIAGLGMAIDFGPQSLSGVYTVTASDTGSPCVVNMTGSALVNAVPPPTAYSVTGGGAFCAGSYGVNVGLSGSDVGIVYKLYLGTTLEGTLTGSGAPIDFGLETAAGIYYAVASNSVFGCTTPMSDSVGVSLIPVVIPHVVVSSGVPANTVCFGTPLTFTATPTNGGPAPTYVWSVNGAFAGTGNSYSYVPGNADDVDVVMTSNVTCGIPAVVNGGLVMTVKGDVIPTVVVNAFPGNFINNNQYDTLTAVAVNGGVTPTFQWYVNSVVVAGAASPTFISNAFRNKDTVSCKVTGCADTAGVGFVVMHVTPRLGIDQIGTGNNSIQITPNPGNGLFSIQAKLNDVAGSGNVDLKITDMAGRVVYTGVVTATSGKIDANVQLSKTVGSGVYLLQLQSYSERLISRIVIEQ